MPPAHLGNALVNAPRATADVRAELVSQLSAVYSGTHRDLEHHLLAQVFRHRMARVPTQVDRQDIEIVFGHREIISAEYKPRACRRPTARRRLVMWHGPERPSELRPCLGAYDGGNQRRAISLRIGAFRGFHVL